MPAIDLASIPGDPVWAALLTLVTLIVLVVAWNRGFWWVINVTAQKEPAVAALGVGLVVWGLGADLGTAGGVAGGQLVAATGVVFLVLALTARYTDRLDL